MSIGIDGIAAGAACIGCCCQMVGFAVASYQDNGLGGLFSQGVGTSMLQFPNIMRRPQIWLAPTLASAVLGPVSTAVLGMTNTPYGAGMGTSGLVGRCRRSRRWARPIPSGRSCCWSPCSTSSCRRG